MARRNPIVFGVVALAIAGLLVVIVKGALWFHKARNTSAASACINNIRQLDSALQQWALENGKKDEDAPDVAEILKYIRGASMPECPNGGRYIFGKMLMTGVRCVIPGDNIFHEQSLYVVDESGKALPEVQIWVEGSLYTTDTNGYASTAVPFGLRPAPTIATAFKDGYQTNYVELPRSGVFKFRLRR